LFRGLFDNVDNNEQQISDGKQEFDQNDAPIFS
jgi:hypothetical protein